MRTAALAKAGGGSEHDDLSEKPSEAYKTLPAAGPTTSPIETVLPDALPGFPTGSLEYEVPLAQTPSILQCCVEGSN